MINKGPASNTMEFKMASREDNALVRPFGRFNFAAVPNLSTADRVGAGITKCG